MTERNTDETRVTRRVDELAYYIHAFADAMHDLSRLGMTNTGIGHAVWSTLQERLPAGTAARVPREPFSDGFGALADVVAATYATVDGESDADRAKRVADAYSAALAMVGIGSAPCRLVGGIPLTEITSSATQVERQATLTIRSLLSEAKVDPGQTPAVQCAVMLHGMPQALSGSLSETKDGGLRMLTPMGAGALVEQFFDYSDVVVVAVQRTISLESPLIVRS